MLNSGQVGRNILLRLGSLGRRKNDDQRREEDLEKQWGLFQLDKQTTGAGAASIWLGVNMQATTVCVCVLAGAGSAN